MGIIEANLLVFIAYNISILIGFFNDNVANTVKKIILILSYAVINCYYAVIALIIELLNDNIKSKVVKIFLVIIIVLLSIITYKNTISILPFLAVLLLIFNTKNKLFSSLLLLLSNIVWMIYDYNNMLYLKFIIMIYMVGYSMISILTYRKGRYDRIKKFKSTK